MSGEPRKDSPSWTRDVFVAVLLTLLSVLLFAVAITSFRWRMVHDGPIMMYTAFLIDRFGYVPYRDFFDMNMPGTHLLYYLVGQCFGYGDLGFRCADLCVLGVLLILTWRFLARFGWLAAWFGAVMFGLLYLREGPMISLQREFLLLLPIAGAIWIATASARLNHVFRWLTVGALFGIAATIKPHAAMGFPVLLAFQVVEMRRRVANKHHRAQSALHSVLASCAGFCIPIVVMILYMWRTRALPEFIEIASKYWPLYGELDAGHRPVSGWTRIGYLAHGYLLFGGYTLWFIPAAAGLHQALFRSRLEPHHKRFVLLLAVFASLYSIYPVISGQFWKYHWLLFAYFMVMLSSLCLAGSADGARGKGRLVPVLVVCAIVFIAIDARQWCRPYFAFGKTAPHGGRPDAIANFLEDNLTEGDTVQPMDWAMGGAVHGMLMAEAKIATPFIYGFHFYHHVSHGYIHQLRSRFIEAFEDGRPRFVIQYIGEEGWVSGEDTTRRFEALENLLDKHYVICRRYGPCVIYERRRPEP